MGIQGLHTKRYVDIVIGELRQVAGLENIGSNKELGEAIINTVFDIEGPRAVASVPSQRSMFVANKLFRPFGEIIESLTSIQNIAIYINSFPYRRQGISQVAYLRYHIESYYEELYILNLRLIAYLKIISRAYRKAANAETIEGRMDALSLFITETLQPHVKRRGAHVHVVRYTDHEIDRLSTIELLCSPHSELSGALSPVFRSAYRSIRDTWRSRITHDSAELDKLVDHFVEVIISCIAPDGKIVYPTRLQKT